jgi:hypothetical protein
MKLTIKMSLKGLLVGRFPGPKQLPYVSSFLRRSDNFKNFEQLPVVLLIVNFLLPWN